MLKEYLIPLGGGTASALFSLSFLSGTGGALIFAYLALLPLFFVSFGWGIRAGNIALAVGVLLVFAFGGILPGAAYFVLSTVPAWVVNRQAVLGKKRRDGTVYWYPIGHILCQLTIIGAIFVAVAALAHIDAEGGFRGAVEDYLKTILTARLGGAPGFDADRFAGSLIPLLPAAAVTSWLLMVTVNGIAAQTLLSRLEKNRRPNPSYSTLEVPEWASWLLVGAAALVLVGSGSIEYFARNLTMILAAPFFFAGLGTIHVLVRRLAAPGMALTALYLILLFSSWAAVAVAGLGIADQWTDLRRRLAPVQGPADEEDE